MSIGIFRHVDSYYGISEYHLLTKSRHPPKPYATMDVDPTEFSSPYPVAVHRAGRRRQVHRPRTVDSNVTEDDCKDALELACVERLRKIVSDTIAHAIKTRKLPPDKTREQFVMESRDTLFQNQSSKNKLPRDIKQRAVEIIRGLHHDDDFSVTDFDWVRRRARNDSIWSDVVKAQFEDIWESSLGAQNENNLTKAKRDEDDPEDPEDPDDPEDDPEAGSRTVTVTLRQLVRPDLYDHIDDIKKNLDDCQEAVTDDLTELSILVHKTTLAIAAGEMYEGRWGAEDGPSRPKTFDVKSLLPDGFEARDNEVSTTLSLAPIPSGLQEAIGKALDKKADNPYDRDLGSLFTKEHLQFIHSSFLGTRGHYKSTKDNHPLWQSSAVAIRDPEISPPKAPEGMSNTISEAIGEFSTNLGNMWKGASYSKALDYLLRTLLRLHLAPNRESKYKETKKKKAQEKQEEKKVKVTSNKIIRRKSRRLCDDLAKALDPDSGTLRRIPVLMELLDRTQRQQQSSNMDDTPSPGQHVAQPIGSESEADESTIQTSVDDTADNDRTPPDFDEDSLSNDDEDETKESSASRLRSLQAVLRVILESPYIDRPITSNYVRTTASNGDGFTSMECEIVARLANQLRPFIPKRRPKPGANGTEESLPHVVLRLPVVLISNAVLRLSGYHDFTRSIAPEISPSSLHGLALGSIGLYEVLGSSGPNNFDISFEGSPITKRPQVSSKPGIKRAIMGAFFDLKKIDNICHEHGMEFSSRIVYKNQYCVRLLGSVIPHGQTIGDGPKLRQGYPVESQLEVRRKNQKGRRRESTWTDMMAMLDVSKEDARMMMEETKAQMKPMESVVRSKKKLTSLRLAQTSARTDYNTSKDRTAYQDLRLARSAVRQQWKDLEEPLTTLKHLRRENYQWMKIANAPKPTQGQEVPRQDTMTTPTWGWRTVEDDVKHTDLSQLQSQCSQDRCLVYSGTDYGICTMSETAPVTAGQLQEHLALYRRQT
ncbi:hypothetical protein BGX31_002132, partial [Mortierella sp. GBA43]